MNTATRRHKPEAPARDPAANDVSASLNATPRPTLDSSHTDDSHLASLLDQLTDLLATGDSLAVSEVLRSHPQHASRLQQLLPALHGLAAIQRDGEANQREGEAPAEPLASNPNSKLQNLKSPAPHSAFSILNSDLPTLGDFRLLREIGRGGMGIVYEAEQLSLKRRVALKILPTASLLDSRLLKRFQTEAQAAAALTHPNIVPIHHIGCDQGVHYYAMQLIDGISLAELIAALRTEKSEVSDQKSEDSMPLPTSDPRLPTSGPARYRRIADLGLQAAAALHHAHEAGIIHRDIKPANLLLDKQGKLWITDFGLARIEGDGNLTMSGDLLGTLRYMSPEQVAGDRLGVDHRTDVYSLCASLYELLTGRPLICGNDRTRLLRQVATADVIPPRAIDRTIPRDLETILLKGLSKEVFDRYDSAQALAADFDRFSRGQPIFARPLTRWQKAGNWGRRHSTFLMTAAACLAIALIVATAAAGFALRAEGRASAAAAEASRNLTLAADRERQMRVALYASDLPAAQRAWQSGDLPALKTRLERHIPRSTVDLDNRGFEWHYLWRLARNPPTLIHAHDSPVTCLECIGGTQLIATGDASGIVHIWLLPSLAGMGQVKVHSTAVLALFEGQAAGELISVGRDGSLARLDLPALKVSHHWRENGFQFTAAATSPDRSLLIAAGNDRRIRFFDSNLQAITAISDPQPTEITCLAFSATGATIFSGDPVGRIRQWPVNPPHSPKSLDLISDPVTALVSLGDDDHLVACLKSSAVGQFSFPGRQYRGYMIMHDGSVHCADRYPHQLAFATGGEDRRIYLWSLTKDQRKFERLQALPIMNAAVTSVRISADGRWLVAGTRNGDLLATDVFLDGAQHMPLSETPAPRPLSWAFASDGTRLVSSSEKGTVQLWDASTGSLLGQLLTGHAGACRVSISPEGRWLIVGAGQRKNMVADLSDPAKPAMVSLPTGLNDGKLGGSFSADGHWLAMPAADALLLWKIGASPVRRLEIKSPRSVYFAPDSRYVVAASRGGELRVWDVPSGRLVTHVAAGPVQWDRMAIDPAGKTIACGDSSSVRIFDFPSMSPRTVLLGHSRFVDVLGFSPDGRTLVTAAADGMRLWNTPTWNEVALLRPFNESPGAIRFTPDGQSLIVAGYSPRISTYSVEFPH